MDTLFKPDQLSTLLFRLRQIRESRKLTLEQAAKLSNNQITAIALGSYERGDRSITANKLLQIGAMYAVPVAELFGSKELSTLQSRVSFDIRKILTGQDLLSKHLLSILKAIATQRRDWNGEVLSLRSSDLGALELFSGFTTEEIKSLIIKYKIPSSK